MLFFENQVRYNESNTDWRVKYGEKRFISKLRSIKTEYVYYE